MSFGIQSRASGNSEAKRRDTRPNTTTPGPDFHTIFSTGGTLSYNRTFLMDRLQLLAALGLYYNDNGTIDSTVASILLGLRYTF